MYATASGAAGFPNRFPDRMAAGFYRAIFDLRVPTVGLGTHRGQRDEATGRAYNHRRQRSERSIRAGLKPLQRDEVAVCAKTGFLTQDAIPASLSCDEVVGGMHSMAPDFLSDQIGRSCENLGVDTIDVFCLDNLEAPLGFVPADRLEGRIRRAFVPLEEDVASGHIRYYRVATWDALRKKVVASATLMQSRILNQMPEAVAGLLPGLAAEAQRAIQFTRSIPGIAVALVGISSTAHLLENLGVANVPPATREEYMRLCQ